MMNRVFSHKYSNVLGLDDEPSLSLVFFEMIILRWLRIIVFNFFNLLF